MKLGIIFKKQFHNRVFGAKLEIRGDEINIKRETDWKGNEVLNIKVPESGYFESFLVSRIQLIYLGEWNK